MEASISGIRSSRYSPRRILYSFMARWKYGRLFTSFHPRRTRISALAFAEVALLAVGTDIARAKRTSVARRSERTARAEELDGNIVTRPGLARCRGSPRTLDPARCGRRFATVRRGGCLGASVADGRSLGGGGLVGVHRRPVRRFVGRVLLADVVGVGPRAVGTLPFGLGTGFGVRFLQNLCI